jgi:hypothetical protein
LTTRQKCRIVFSTNGDPMTRIERLYAASPAECCICEQPLTVRALEEFYGMTDDTLRADIHCPSCAVRCLTLCHECSCRYTADPAGVCGECASREFSMAV